MAHPSDPADPARVGPAAAGPAAQAGSADAGPAGGGPADVSSTSAAPAPRGQRGHHRPARDSVWWELPVLIVIALALTFLLKTFVVQAYYIPSGSMEQTLLVGDRVLVNKLVYDTRGPHRGEVVVFKRAGTNFPNEAAAPATSTLGKVGRAIGSTLGFAQSDESDFVKRVIGLPGDQVACCTGGHVTVNGTPLDETYLYEDDQRPFPQTTVPKGMLWVMGDHRSVSADSRVYGLVPESSVIGRAFVRVWPFSRFARLPVPATFAHVPAGTAAVAQRRAGLPVDGAAAAAALVLPLVGTRGRRLPALPPRA